MSFIDDDINISTNLSISPIQINTEIIKNKNSSYKMPEGEFDNILETLKIQNSFRQCNIMCDVTIIANDGIQFPAHKVILSSSSTFFLSKFNDVDYNEKNKKSMQIKEVDSNTLETIINYIYTFKLDMTENTIVNILKASHYLQLNTLKEKCYDFIEYNLNLKNCISIMKLAKLISHDRLYNLSFSYVLDNLFNLETSNSLLSYEEILTSISDNTLITGSEEQVFKFVLNWTKFNEKNGKKYFLELMKHIRLSFVPNTFLSNVLTDPLLKDCMTKEYIIKYLNGPNSKCDVRNTKLIKNESLITDILIAIETIETNIYCSNISSNLLDWKSGPNFFIPPGSLSKIVALENRFLFSIGGKNDNTTTTDEVYILDLSTTSKKWIPTTSMISSRRNHAVCTNKKRIFVVGGINAEGEVLKTIEAFDIDTKIWTIHCTMSHSRKYCSAIYHNNFLYIIGGINEDGQVLLTVECFDDLTSTWNSYIDPLPQPLFKTCITIYKNDLYVIGGMNIFNGNQEESLNTIFKFTLSRGSVWCTLSSLLEPRHLASCAVLDEKLYVFGGLIMKEKDYYRNTIEILDLECNLISIETIIKFFPCYSQNILKLNKHYITSSGVKL